MSDVVDTRVGLSPEEIQDFIECDIANTQRWRGEKALEYPDDARSRDAECLLGKIVDTLGAVSPELLRKHNDACADPEERVSLHAIEAWGQILRDVGFRNHFDDATALIEAFLDRLS